MSKIIRVPVVIRGYVVSYDENDDPAEMEQELQDYCVPVVRGNSMLESTVEIDGPTLISCCRDPKVRGGRCENCGTWINDK
jgi:hypothetical protein